MSRLTSIPLAPGINLHSPENRANPYPIYTTLREHHPVCQVKPGGLWAVSCYDDVHFVLSRPDIFSTSAYKVVLQPDWLIKNVHRGEFLLLQDPPVHTEHRMLVDKHFTGAMIEALIPLMKKSAKTHVMYMQERDRDGKDVELLQDFVYPYLADIVCRITGTEDSLSLPDTRYWVELLETIPFKRPDYRVVLRIESVLKKQFDYFKKIIIERRGKPREDIISVLANAEIQGERLDITLVMQAVDALISTAFQTTAQMLGFSMLRLSRQPELISLLKESPDKIPAFIEELMRHNPASRCVLRQVKEPVTLSGVTLGEGKLVLAMLASANRDPLKFPNPDEFDMTRENTKEHLGFGFGTHSCLAAMLVRLELKIALETLLDTYSEITCPPEDKLEWIESFTNHGLTDLPIHLQ